ncbi:MAG: hypothetical protein HXY53_08090 [Nitrospirae bacterium]|nr:hypothetical protein [Nitrospirota bacterium]
MKNQIRYLQELFYNILNDYGKVYIIVKYSENTVIGKRGFTDEEKNQGLILVFNQRNHKNLRWENDGSIVTTLGFGMNNRQENCFLHFDDIISVFSPDAKVKFERWDFLALDNNTKEIQSDGVSNKKRPSDEKVISLENFRKAKPH